jgi:iron complex transport system substrate-binding protein
MLGKRSARMQTKAASPHWPVHAVLRPQERSYNFRIVPRLLCALPGWIRTVAVVMAALLLTIAAPGRPDASDAPPVHRRIVSLAPSITEILFALGAGPEVVGVSNYCDYPAEVRRLPRVGSFVTPNLEAIAALRPTLVIGLDVSSRQRELDAIAAMGIPVLTVTEEPLAGVELSIQRIGGRIGRATEAGALLATMNSRMEAVRKRLADAPSPKVLMLVGHQPLVAVGQGTLLDELLKMAHAENVADAARQEWPRLGIEYVIATAPEVIVDGQMGNEARSPSDFWERYPTIPAVRSHRIYGYDEDAMLRPGPRVVNSLEMIAAMVHPEVFGAPPAAPARSADPHDAHDAAKSIAARDGR